ncbi:hypothetical protein [Luteimonas sp. e5]
MKTRTLLLAAGSAVIALGAGLAIARQDKPAEPPKRTQDTRTERSDTARSAEQKRKDEAEARKRRAERHAGRDANQPEKEEEEPR